MNEKRDINNSQGLYRRRSLRRNQTPQEVILWSKLRNRQTGFKWKRQVSVGKYIVDFYCDSQKLIVEIDGSQHLENKIYDIERDTYLSSLGYIILRFWNNDINTNIEGVMLEIEQATSPQPSPGQQREMALYSSGSS